MLARADMAAMRQSDSGKPYGCVTPAGLAAPAAALRGILALVIVPGVRTTIDPPINKNMKLDIFVPPGVQARLYQRLGLCPRQGTPGVAAKIKSLWLRRNNCPENEIESIDDKMEQIMVDSALQENGRKTRVIFESHNLHGTGSKRCKVFILKIRSRRDYWANVTNVGCPACGTGVIRWHEAGYVPGYRICDSCGRNFLASGAITDEKLPKLILDTR